jgi:dTDP-4-dehydrorhamnose reductase
MSARLLVLGGAGMLGHRMFRRLREDHPDTTCTLRAAIRDLPDGARPLFPPPQTREHVDVGSEPFWTWLHDLRPDVVVNCAGVIKQRNAARAVIPCLTINALLPHRLAEVVAGWGGRLIHFSTDCVFSGARGHYREDDVSDATDLYGRTKFLGEVHAPNALTLRTSIIGRELQHHRSLLDWFLAQRGGRITGYTRAIYSGVTTTHLATLVARLVTDHPRLSGLYHVASEPISKHDLLCLLRDAYRIPVEIVPSGDVVCDRSLDGSRFRAAANYTCPPWPALVSELAGDPTPYPELVAFS